MDDPYHRITEIGRFFNLRFFLSTLGWTTRDAMLPGGSYTFWLEKEVAGVYITVKTETTVDEDTLVHAMRLVAHQAFLTEESTLRRPPVAAHININVTV